MHEKGPATAQVHAAHPHGTEEAPAAEGTPEWAEWVKRYYRDIESYDWVDVTDHVRGPEALFHKNRERVVRKLVEQYRPRDGAPILDAGCGTGLNLRHLPSGSVGLDINPRNVAIVAERLPQHRVLEGDVEDMPFPAATFGLVVCTEVLEHVPDPGAALREIRRVLRPNGVLVGSVPARSLVWRLRFLSSTCPHSEPFHNQYKLSEVRTLLEGWSIERLAYSALQFNVVFVARS